MFCKKCGEKIGDEVKFCNKCGEQTGVVAEKIEQINNNQITLPTSILKRLSNRIIDIIVIYIILAVTVFLAPNFDSVFISSILYISGVAFFVVGYYILCESIWGKTLGKLVTKTKVVDRSGKKPGFWRVVGRSFARWIPFEPLSYLFGGFPVGWHDTLSKTFVVSKDFTEEDVKKMDVNQIKTNNKNNSSIVATIVLILVGSLVMIAIIGILSSVVLASLNTARQKGSDAAIKANISNLKASAEVYYSNNNNSYSGFCATTDTINKLKESSKLGSADGNEFNYNCNDNLSSYVISSPLKAKNYWCVDNTGASKEIDTAIGSNLSCSGGISSTEKINWSSYINDGFSILFPKQPAFDSKDNLPVDGSDMTYSWHSYQADDGKTSFYVYKYFYSSNLNVTDQDKVLDGYLNTLVNSTNGNKLISSSYTYQSSNRALDFFFKNDKEMVRGRFILVGQTPYLIMMDYFQSNYNDAMYNKFINSFEII